MKQFEYVRPRTRAEAITAASTSGAVVLAGGTNLLDLMKGNALGPARLVDITRLAGLDQIETLPDGSTRMCALVRNGALARDSDIAKHFPLVAEAILSGASPQLRNAATVGGNLLQRTRCSYFADPHSSCNKRQPGAGCDALGGENRHHAVLGWDQSCIAVNPSDFCVALVALDASVEIEGPSGRRQVLVADFHRLPEQTPWHETVLEHGDLVTGVVLPPQAAAFASHARYLKVRDRTSYAFAITSAAAALRLDGDRIGEARLALGGVAMKPWRSAAAEAELVGRLPTREAFRRAADVSLASARPSGDNGFKIELARRTATRALMLAHAGTPSRMPAFPGSAFVSETEAVVDA